ncbi:adenosine kinase [Spirochaetia bacterium]|nr:adenosine kinase [Spirochaetia bacterium]
MAEKEIELLCIGNAMVDIFAQGDEALAARYGITEAVQHIEYENLKELAAALPKHRAHSGGGAANAAKIAGFLGIKTSLIGAVGVNSDPTQRTGPLDRMGALFEADLAAAGVQTHLFKRQFPTGLCLMLELPKGETRIAAAPSAALELGAEDIDEAAVKKAQVIVLDGFMMDRQDLVRRILELAARNGTAVALDVSSAHLAEARAPELATYSRLYPMILFMNEDEAKAFYLVISKQGSLNPSAEAGDASDILTEEMFDFFKGFTANELFPIVAVKLGKRGAVVFAGGAIHRAETMPIIPLDTTGAGDAFCGAFLSAWIRNKSLSECASLGNKVAREVLNVKGTGINGKKLKGYAKHLQIKP